MKTTNPRQYFFIRIGQHGRATEAKDTQTIPLFPLALILAADGTLKEDAQFLVTECAIPKSTQS